jgi:heme A synthase
MNKTSWRRFVVVLVILCLAVVAVGGITTLVYAQDANTGEEGNIIANVIRGDVPFGDFEAAGEWSLLNMILASICFISMIFLLVGGFRERKCEDFSARIVRLFGVVIAVVTIVIWGILDKLQMPTAFLDQYSPIVLTLFALFAIAVVALNAANKKNKEEVAC